MGRQKLLDPGSPIVFQAQLPDTGDWIKSNTDQSKLLLVVPLEVGAVLTAATPRLANRVLRVEIGADKESAN